MNQFKREVGDLKDKFRIGRLITEEIHAFMDRFRAVNKNDSINNNGEIEAEATLSRVTLLIIYENLKMKKLAFG
jgi:hypothetical protein